MKELWHLFHFDFLSSCHYFPTPKLGTNLPRLLVGKPTFGSENELVLPIIKYVLASLEVGLEFTYGSIYLWILKF
jgi:hypothetical protein